MSGQTHLETVLAEELVAGLEGNLDDGAELSELLGGVALNVGDALGAGERVVEERKKDGWSGRKEGRRRCQPAIRSASAFVARLRHRESKS